MDIIVIFRVEGLQAGYFEPTFKRIMEKEAYNDPVKTRYVFCSLIGSLFFFFSRQQQILSQKKNLGKAFLPSDGDKRKKLPFYGQFFIHFQRLLDLVIIMGRLLVQAT